MRIATRGATFHWLQMIQLTNVEAPDESSFRNFTGIVRKADDMFPKHPFY